MQHYRVKVQSLYKNQKPDFAFYKTSQQDNKNNIV